MSDEIRADLASLRTHLAALHTKSDIAIRALLHLLSRQPDMAIHDDILAALSTNDAALVAVGAQVDTLVADYTAGTSAFNDILPRVTAQGSAIAALDAKVSAALPVADAPQAAPAADASAATPATDASPAPTPVAPVAPSIVIPTPNV